MADTAPAIGGSCGSSWCAANAAEVAAVEQLCAAHQRLLREGDLVDLRSEAGHMACADFLNELDKTAKAMRVQCVSRAYRVRYSANYRALFPENARLYRVDVLETSLDQHSAIWVNGSKFELSAEALWHAESLQRAWVDLGAVLERIRVAYFGERRPVRAGVPPKPSREDLERVLVALDSAWAHFERKYITELIAIEEQARFLVVKAVKCESHLRALQQQQPADHASWKAAERELVQCIAQLNGVANHGYDGLDYLGYDILESARKALRATESELIRRGCTGEARAAREPARVLASEVLASFHAVCNYLQEVGTCIERVDPHLCNNVGMVARLGDWEKTWEVGARYVRNGAVLEAVCDLVSEIKAAQAVVPALTSMCEDHDAELFMVLPRMVLLLFAAKPAGKRAGLVRRLLPHRFAGQLAAAAPLASADGELKAFLAHFDEAVEALRAPRPKGRALGAKEAWEALVRRAVLGPQEAPEDVPEASERLMRELEGWSLELQRHCPQDWNQCSAVLMQCLTGGSRRQSATEKFRV